MAIARVGGSFGLFSASLLHLAEVAIRFQPQSNPVRCDCGQNLSQVLAEAAKVEKQVREEEKVSLLEDLERVALDAANKTLPACRLQEERLQQVLQELVASSDQGQLGQLWASVLSALASLGAVAVCNMPLRLRPVRSVGPPAAASRKVLKKGPTRKIVEPTSSGNDDTGGSSFSSSSIDSEVVRARARARHLQG
jgi:hypothetical protein